MSDLEKGVKGKVSTFDNLKSASAFHAKIYYSTEKDVGQERIDFYKNLLTSKVIQKWLESDKGLSFFLGADRKGLKIDMGGDGAGSIHAHFPYHLMTYDFVKKIGSDFAAQFPELEIALLVGISEVVPREKSVPENIDKEISENLDYRIFNESEEFDIEKASLLLSRGGRIPKKYFEKYIATNAESPKENILNLLRIAELLQNKLGTMEQIETDPHKSFALSMSAKKSYESQIEFLREIASFNIGQIIEVVFSKYSIKALEEMGISISVSNFAKGDKMLSFWSEEFCKSFLLRPEITVGQDFFTLIEDMENGIDKILSRGEFEILDAHMKLYVLIHDRYLKIKKQLVEQPENVDSEDIMFLKHVLSKELDDPTLRVFLRDAVNFIQNSSDQEDRRIFSESLEKIILVLKAKMFQTAGVLFQERLLNPERVIVEYGPSYVSEYPKDHLKDRKSDPFSPIMAGHKSTQVTMAISPNQESMPFALCAKMMRLLKIEQKNLVSCLAGSSNMPDQNGDPISLAISNSVYALAKRYNANVGMPGTQPGYGGILYKPYMLDDGSDKPDYFSIIPGKNVWFKGNNYFNENDKKHSYPIVPIKAFVTPFDGGWGEFPDEVRQHNLIQESIYAAVSDGFKRVTMVFNAGFGAMTEMVMALLNSSSIVLVKDSGRIATLVACLFEKTQMQFSKVFELTDLQILKRELLVLKDGGVSVGEIDKILADPVYLKELAMFFNFSVSRLGQISVCNHFDMEQVAGKILE